MKFSDPNQAASTAESIVTVPLGAIGSPKNGIRLYLATVNGGIEDIAPAQPLSLINGAQKFQLSVNALGTGKGTVTSSPAGINCGTDCSENYKSDTSVTLTATPDSGSTFSGWSGACSGTSSCVVPMTSAKNVEATFKIAKKADFIVTGITLNPISPKVNSAFSAKMTIKNQGNATGNGRQLGVWKNRATISACKTTANKYVWIGNLAAGASKTVTVTGLMIGSKGTKTLRAFVDSNCGTSESNEDNNQFVKKYTVN